MTSHQGFQKSANIAIRHFHVRDIKTHKKACKRIMGDAENDKEDGERTLETAGRGMH